MGCAAQTTPKGHYLLSEFETMGLPKRLIERLSELGLTTPTPIQARAIPEALNGHDVLGLAQTGTGKTAAFGLPLITLLSENPGRPSPKTVRALILAPTRELASQIVENLKDYTKGTPIKVALVVGGQSINVQSKRLENGIDVLVATPGRLIDLMDRRALTLKESHFLVLDEADQMLDMGFIPDVEKIVSLLPKMRQTLFFSATMAPEIRRLSDAFLQNPKEITVAPKSRPVTEAVTQGIANAPEPHPHAVFVPGPVRQIRQQRHTHGRRQNRARHRSGNVPVFDVGDDPDGHALAIRQLPGRTIDNGGIWNAILENLHVFPRVLADRNYGQTHDGKPDGGSLNPADGKQVQAELRKGDQHHQDDEHHHRKRECPGKDIRQTDRWIVDRAFDDETRYSQRRR